MIDYKKAREKWKAHLSERQARFVLAMADNGLKIKAATDELGISNTSGRNYRDIIKDHTGLDVLDFWDMTKLIEMAMKVLVDEQPEATEAKAQ